MSEPRYDLATAVAEAACRLQDAIDEAEKNGLVIDVSTSTLTQRSFPVTADANDGSGYEETRTTISVKTLMFMSLGGK